MRVACVLHAENFLNALRSVCLTITGRSIATRNCLRVFRDRLTRTLLHCAPRSDDDFPMPTFPRSPTFDREPELLIPVVQEELDIGKRVVDTGIVRVRTVTQAHREIVEMPLDREDVVVERIAIGRAVDAPVEAREEGDVLIVPVHEEVIVVKRQLVLKEELHIRRRVATVNSSQSVEVRRQDVVIEREPAAGNHSPH